MTSDSQSVKDFLIASVNMLPIVLSAFFLIHSLKMLKVGEVYIFILILLLSLYFRVTCCGSYSDRLQV